MAQIYNLTNISSADNLVQLTKATNQMAGEMLGFAILLSLMVILFASFRNQTPAVRFATASFITTIISFLFRIIDMTGDFVVFVFILLTSIGIIITFYQKE